MTVYFVLDEQGDPRPVSDSEAWVRWCERADRGVARTVVTPDIAVLTIFSGVDEAVDGTSTAAVRHTRLRGRAGWRGRAVSDQA